MAAAAGDRFSSVERGDMGRGSVKPTRSTTHSSSHDHFEGRIMQLIFECICYLQCTGRWRNRLLRWLRQQSPHLDRRVRNGPSFGPGFWKAIGVFLLAVPQEKSTLNSGESQVQTRDTRANSTKITKLLLRDRAQSAMLAPEDNPLSEAAQKNVSQVQISPRISDSATLQISNDQMMDV